MTGRALSRGARLVAIQCRKQILGLGVVAERLADVDEAVHISWPEDEAATQLKRVFAQPVLPHADGFGAFAGAGIVRPEKMKQVCFFQPELAISHALIVDQEREGDAGLLPEMPGVTYITQADGRDSGSALPKLLLVFAQLRDVLAAEDSTIVPQEDNHRRRISPQLTQPHRLAIHIRQCDGGQFVAIALSHGGTLSWPRKLMSSGGSGLW
jgi:hypothetical protein